MDVSELQKIMIDNGVAIRAIPREVVSICETRHKDKFPDGQVYYDEVAKRDMLRVIRIPQFAGKFIIVKGCGMGENVRFSKPRFFDSIDEAVKALEEKSLRRDGL